MNRQISLFICFTYFIGAAVTFFLTAVSLFLVLTTASAYQQNISASVALIAGLFSFYFIPMFLYYARRFSGTAEKMS